jgi:hypothetical protein
MHPWGKDGWYCPDRPSPSRSWLDDLQGQSGSTFDFLFEARTVEMEARVANLRAMTDHHRCALPDLALKRGFACGAQALMVPSSVAKKEGRWTRPEPGNPSMTR